MPIKSVLIPLKIDIKEGYIIISFRMTQKNIMKIFCIKIVLTIWNTEEYPLP